MIRFFYFKYDTMTATTLRPVTHPCFECPTQTEKRQNLCSDQVVTFKFACTDSQCFKTNPCMTPKPGCEKNRFKTSKPCCIAHMTDAYRKSNYLTLLWFYLFILFNIPQWYILGPSEKLKCVCVCVLGGGGRKKYKWHCILHLFLGPHLTIY